MQDMVRGAMVSEGTQIEQLGDFLIRNSMVSELRDHQWSLFARRYNGPGQVDAYAAKLAAAYAKFSAGVGPDDLNQQELDQLN